MRDSALALSGRTFARPSHGIEDNWINQPVINRFEQMVARHGAKLAVDDGATRLTYSALGCAVGQLSRQVALLVPPGRPVGIVLPNGASFPIAALSCLAAGRPYVPIDPSYPAERNEALIKEAGLAAVIVNGDNAGYSLAASLPCLNIAESFAGTGELPVASVFTDGPAVILYTSGSTGRPKGICYDQRAIMERVAHASALKRLTSEDRVFLFSSPCTIGGLRVPFLALLNGATLYWANPHQIGIDGALRFLQDVRPTVGFAVPVLLRTLLRLPEARQVFANARVIRTGGDVILKDDLELWRAVLPGSCRVLITLTSTEMPAVFQWFVPQEWKPDGSHLPVGYPRPEASFSIVKDNARPAAPGEVGELVVKSRYLALGHWQNGRLRPGPFRTDADDPTVRVFNTGDLVRMRADGLAEMMGRKDRRLKIRGFRIEPGDVERALRSCAGVAEAAVIARRKGEEATSLVAYVVPCNAENEALAEAIENELAIRLPLHMRPAQICFIDKIPQLPGFKIDIPALEQLDERQRASANLGATGRNAAARTPTEKSLIRIWVDILGCEHVDVQADFFSLGGHSLLAARLIGEINRTYAITLGASALYQNPTPGKLAGLIDSLRKDGKRQPAVVTLRAEGQNTPVYFMHAGPDEIRLGGLIGGNRPVFAIDVPWPLALRSAVAADRVAEFPSLTDYVAPFAQALRAHLHSSSCILVGHSFAGLMAFEAARQLHDAGGKVEAVILLDARSHSRVLGIRQSKWQMKGAWQRIKQRAHMRLAGIRPFPRCVSLQWQTLQPGDLTTMLDEQGNPLPWEFLLRLRKVMAMAYVRRPLHSRGVLFRVDTTEHEKALYAFDESYGWDNVFEKGLQIVTVPGDHLSMIREHNVTLACKITESLQQGMETRPA
jgi:acyl-coenzyme A synthetase/AMP-(fatty) acid ligase/thioesterase domain-containing protein